MQSPIILIILQLGGHYIHHVAGGFISSHDSQRRRRTVINVPPSSSKCWRKNVIKIDPLGRNCCSCSKKEDQDEGIEKYDQKNDGDLSMSQMLKEIHEENFQSFEDDEEFDDVDEEFDEEEISISNSIPKPTSKAKAKKKNSKTTTKTKRKKKKPSRIKVMKSKADIKTMKYLMNQEVERLIEANDPSAPDVAEDNIQQLHRLYEKEGNEEYKPRILSYNILIRAYGKLQSPDAPILAEQTLKRIIQMYQQSGGDEEIKPTVITYTEVIDSYARSKKRNAAEQAERILLEMMEKAEDPSGNDVVVPTSITCDVVINAWAKRGTREGAQRAEHVLEKMEYLRTMGKTEIQPSRYSFATVISAWAKSGSRTEGAERAQYILERMIEFKNKIVLTDGKDDEYAKRLTPDTVVYNSCIDAWARSRDPRAGTKAEEILNMMELESQSGVDNCVTPDSITYNSVINCYANSRHVSAAKSAEKILKKMENAAKSFDDGTWQGSRVAPNTRTYNQVLKCYATSNLPGAPQRADSILKYMLVSNNKEIKPDVISFATCLDVWAKSKEKGKAEKSYALVEKLVQLYKLSGNEKLKPTTMIFNTVLNCCAFSAYTDDEEKKKAITIAVSLFNDMKKYDFVEADAISYGSLIKCIGNLVPFGNARNKMASEIFVKCRDKGLVNGLVFDEIRRALPGNALAKLLEEPLKKKRYRKPFKTWDLKDLPHKWKGELVKSLPQVSPSYDVSPSLKLILLTSPISECC